MLTVKPRIKLFGDRSPSNHMSSLQYTHIETLASQIGRRDQSIVTLTINKQQKKLRGGCERVSVGAWGVVTSSRFA